MSMTRAQARTMIRRHLGETTAAFWQDSDLNTWMNEAGHDLAYETKSIRKSTTFTTTSDTQEYTLSTVVPNALSITECWINIAASGTNWQRLTETTREELEEVRRGYRDADSGIPTRYYWEKERNVLGFDIPTGGNAVGSGKASVYYTKDYTDLTADAQYISTDGGLPAYLDLAVVWWVVATGYQHRGYGDKANDAWGKYQMRVRSYYVERDRAHEDEGWLMKPERSSW